MDVVETFSDIREDVLSNLEKSAYIDSWNSGQLGIPITREEFFKGVFEDCFRKKEKYSTKEFYNFYHLVKITDKKVSKSYTVSDLNKLNEMADHFTHITYNPFSTRKSREAEYLNGLYNMVLDFDLNKGGYSIKLSPEELAQHIYQTTGLYPHAIWGTKTPYNYQALFKLEKRSAVSKAIWSHVRIARTLVALTGADIMACSPSGLHRIPKGQIYQYRDFNKNYTIKDLVEDLLVDPVDIEIKNNISKINHAYEAITKKAKVRDGKILNLAEMDMKKNPAIDKLLNAEIGEGFRNNSCFTLALLFYAWGYTVEETSDYIYKTWLPKLEDNLTTSGFEKKEIDRIIGNAYSGRYKGASSEWISIVTGVDFHYQIRHTTFFNSRRVLEEERKTLTLKKSKEIVMDWLRKNKEAVIKPNMISDDLGIHVKTISRTLLALEKEGTINRTVVNGHARFGFMVEIHVADITEEKDVTIETQKKIGSNILQHSRNKKEEKIQKERQAKVLNIHNSTLKQLKG